MQRSWIFIWFLEPRHAKQRYARILRGSMYRRKTSQTKLNSCTLEGIQAINTKNSQTQRRTSFINQLPDLQVSGSIFKERPPLLPSFPPSASWVLNSLFSRKTWGINKSLAADPTTTAATLICVYLTFCSLLKTNDRICSPKDCSLSPNSLPLPINPASFFTLGPSLITITSYSNTATTDKNTSLSKSPLDNTMDTP